MRLRKYWPLLELILSAWVCGPPIASAMHYIQSTTPVDITNEIDQLTTEIEFDFLGPVQLWSDQVIVYRDDVTLLNLAVQFDGAVNERTTLLQVVGNGVTVRNFSFTGTADLYSPVDKEGGAMLAVRGDGVNLEQGVFHAVRGNAIIVGGKEFERNLSPRVDITSCSVRDISGFNIERDLVSIAGNENQVTTGCVVEDVSLRQSSGWISARGALEFGDRITNSHAVNIFAKRARYAVDVQDHGENERNTRIMVDGVRAINCELAVRVIGKDGSGWHKRIGFKNIKASNMKLPYVADIEHCKRCKLVGMEVWKTSPSNVPIIRVKDSKNIRIIDCTIEDGPIDEKVHVESINSKRVAVRQRT